MDYRSEINKAKEERAKLISEAREINDKALAEERDLSAEESQEFERRMEDADKLEEKAARLERLAGATPTEQRKLVGAGEGEWEELEEDERKLPEWLPQEFRANIERAKLDGKAPTTFREFNQYRAGVRPQDDADYRWAFFRYMTAKSLGELTADEQRVLSKASAGAGANLVPTEFQRTLIDALRETGVMREISTVITTDGGETLQVPTISSHGTAAWTAENAAYTASDEAFGQSSLSAYKAATLIKVSEELLQDSAFDLDSFIRLQFGLRIGILENTAYVAGDGSGKPTGVTTQASAGVTAAGAAAITSDELIDLYHSLLTPYRRNARWVFKDSTVKLIRKLKDSDGQYIWQPGLQLGEPDVLLGKPVHVDPDMPAATTGLVSVLFGDFSYYWIRDVNGIAFQRLNELYAENGQVGFRAYHRTDGKLLNTAAVKKLTQA